VRLARDSDRWPRSRHDDAVGRERLARFDHDRPLLVGADLEPDDLAGDDLGLRPIRHLTQVGAPLAVRGAESAAVDPVGIPILLRMLSPLAKDAVTSERDPDYAITAPRLVLYVAVVDSFLALLDID
jgi:hypothetical protein